MTRSLLVLGIIGPLAAAPRSAPPLRAALSFTVPSDPQISPDGAHVVYQLSRTNWNENAFESELWLADTDKPKQPKSLETGSGWNGDAQWSPDSQTVAFISDRTGRRQIYLIAASGGASRKLTAVKSGVNLFRWAPDSKSIAFTTEEDRDRHPDYEIVKSSTSQVRLMRIAVSGDAQPAEIGHLGNYSVRSFAWSPDAGAIVFEDNGIFALDLNTSAITTIATGSGPYRNPMWSPDGKSIAFETAGGAEGFYYSNWYVSRAPAAGGHAEPVTKSFDENTDLYAWTPAGIYFGALQRTTAHLFIADAETHAIRRVTNPENTLNLQFSVTPDGTRFTFVRSSTDDVPEVFASNGTQLTDYSGQVAPYELARRELVRWKSTDGTEIEGVLYKPQDFDPAKKYPLLVAIHGGPVAVDQPCFRPDRTYPLEQFVAKGALVLRPNYRGSAGYGAKLRALAVRNLGTGDAADIVSGVDALVAKGFVDPDRVGAMGWSEGGYVAAFLATATQRFKAVSVGAGISDWLTYYVNTDITPFARQYLQATPWQDPEIYRKASPITYINQAKTPVLIQHGDEDRRVPIPNAYELRQALEDRQVPVRMIVYKGFGHTIDRPKQQMDVMQHNLDWFDQWILNPQPPEPMAVAQAAQRRESGDSQ